MTTLDPSITVTVNGEPRQCSPGMNLETLLLELGHHPRAVVVEYNGTILPRAAWKGQMVVESDVLEVVTIVGGGS